MVRKTTLDFYNIAGLYHNSPFVQWFVCKTKGLQIVLCPICLVINSMLANSFSRIFAKQKFKKKISLKFNFDKTLFLDIIGIWIYATKL